MKSVKFGAFILDAERWWAERMAWGWGQHPFLVNVSGQHGILDFIGSESTVVSAAILRHCLKYSTGYFVQRCIHLLLVHEALSVRNPRAESGGR